MDVGSLRSIFFKVLNEDMFERNRVGVKRITGNELIMFSTKYD